MKKTILTMTMSLLAAGSSMAVGITIANHSFETPDGGGDWNNDPTSWTELGPSDAFNEKGSAIGLTPGDGIFLGGLNGAQAGTQPFGVGGFPILVEDVIHQDLGVAFAANTTYTIDFIQGDRFGGGGNLIVGLFSGSVEIDELIEGSGTFDLGEINGGETIARQVQFTTGGVAPTGNVQIFIAAESSKQYFDNFVLDATVVPEPSSAALLGLGGLALVFRRRK